MNRTLAILLLFWSVLFTACQSDEPAIDEGGGKTDGKDLGYIAVSIVQPKSVTGRGALDDGFQNGTDVENEAKEATFFVFNSSGICKSIQTIGLTGSKEESSINKPYTEKIYNAVLVFDNITDENKYSGEIFCVLNAISKIKAYGGTNIESLSKSEFLTKVGDWYSNCQSAGTFIMTNSAYKETKGETTSEVCGTPFIANDFKQSAKEALDDPKDIYVERVVAKVTTIKSSNWTNNGVQNPLDNKLTLTIRITGIEIANIAKTAYLFKNLGAVNTNWPEWSSVTGFYMHDADNKRCYWEDMPNGLEFGNQNYSTIINNATATNKVYPELSDANYSSNKYIHPNTYRNKGNATNSTCVLVTAQLLNKTTTTGDGGTSTDTYTPADLVWIMGGYTDSISAKNILCDYLASEQYAVKEVDKDNNASYIQITNEDLKWTQKQDKSATDIASIQGLKDYQAVAQVALKNKNNITRTVLKYNFVTKKEVKKSDNTDYTIYDADAYLVSNTKFFAEVFKDGLCYYFVNIDHAGVLGASKENNSYYGVVRNHIYKLELNSIRGIGTAVFDPDKVIVPVKPPHDNFSYLAARINVLPWKLVEQTVDFQGN